MPNKISFTLSNCWSKKHWGVNSTLVKPRIRSRLFHITILSETEEMKIDFILHLEIRKEFHLQLSP